MISNIRTAIDVLRNRIPGALAMLKAKNISISIHHYADRENDCKITFHFEQDAKACGTAYRAIERLYEMDRVQDSRR